MQINMRLQRVCRGCVCLHACVAGSGLRCVLQQAVARNGGGFPRGSTTWLIFSGFGFNLKTERSRIRPNLGPHSGSQHLASWMADSILTLKVICQSLLTCTSVPAHALSAQRPAPTAACSIPASEEGTVVAGLGQIWEMKNGGTRFRWEVNDGMQQPSIPSQK